jgi:hypothetical protein
MVPRPLLVTGDLPASVIITSNGRPKMIALNTLRRAMLGQFFSYVDAVQGNGTKSPHGFKRIGRELDWDWRAVKEYALIAEQLGLVALSRPKAKGQTKIKVLNPCRSQGRVVHTMHLWSHDATPTDNDAITPEVHIMHLPDVGAHHAPPEVHTMHFDLDNTGAPDAPQDRSYRSEQGLGGVGESVIPIPEISPGAALDDATCKICGEPAEVNDEGDCWQCERF